MQVAEVLRSEVVRGVLRATHKLLPNVRRFFKYRNLNLYVPPGVFNPTYTLSTDLVISALSLPQLRPRGVVAEVGCGSGVISVYIAKEFGGRGVNKVLSCDVSPLALATSRLNASLNGVGRDVLKFMRCEDLVKEAAGKVDLGIANPPYLPLSPKDELDLNWCGGSELSILREVIECLAKLVKPGGRALVTASSLTGLGYVTNLLRNSGFASRVVSSIRTPFDSIYLILCIKK